MREVAGIVIGIVLVLLMTSVPSHATPPFGNDSEADAFCAVRVEGDPVAFCGGLVLNETDAEAICRQHTVNHPVALCGNLNVSDDDAVQMCGAYQNQICAPYAEQVCGDCLDFDLAVQLTHTRLSCQYAASSASVAASNCGTAVSNQNNCPDVSVTVKAAEVQCRRCRLRDITRKYADGTTRVIRTVKTCKGPCVLGTDVQVN